MSLSEEIASAIGAHGAWKLRLRTAVNTGRSELSCEQVGKDDQCPFGKWLYGPGISSEMKTSEHYRTCRTLHAEFHRCASKVLKLAVAGEKQQAETELSPAGAFTAVSNRLMSAMTAWKTAAR